LTKVAIARDSELVLLPTGLQEPELLVGEDVARRINATMATQRKDYRHSFSPEERIQVELELNSPRAVLHGEIVNLSVGGMRVHFAEPIPALNPSGRLAARAVIREKNLDIALTSSVIYAGQGDQGAYCGLRFLPLANRTADEKREQIVWRFLLEKQRRLQRMLQESAN
jgi:PilZ domain